MTARDQEEQDLRIDQMTINIDKMRADLKWEQRKFAIQLAATIAVAVAATAAAMTYFAPHQAPPAPPPNIIINIPGLPAPNTGPAAPAAR